MNYFSSIFYRLKLFRNRIASVHRPKWFQWSLVPKAGNPPTLSVLEAVVYFIILSIGIWLFLQLNYIPRKSIIIEADRLTNFRYVEKRTESWFNDSTYFLHYEKANFNLRIPMTFAKKQNKSELATTLLSEIQSDSIALKCSVVSNPFPDKISTRLMNRSHLSKYWNIIFEKALRDNEMLPAPNESVDFQTKITNPDYSTYYETRDLFNKVSSHSMMKSLDSCEQNLKENILRDSLKGKDLISCYRICLKSKNCGYYRNKSKIVSKPNECPKCGKIHSINYSTHKFFEDNELSVIESYTAIAQSDSVHHFSKKGESQFGFGFLGNTGWFSLHDISQGYYDIELQTASIDSIQLTIDFVGAVTFWPSIEPDEKSGTYIKYSDPIKMLKIRREGLHLFYESKELANKQAIRLFAVTAFISGLFIIMLTFLIIGVYRAQRVLRNFKKTNLN